jgi:3-oxoacyl-[acyl-carrier protein] reductase
VSVPNSYDIAGKVAIVTGASGGIGRQIVQRLSVSGATVWSWDQRPLPVDGTRTQTVDVTDAGQIADALATISNESKRVDILVNNAGYLGVLHPFERHDPEDWGRIIQVNLIGMMSERFRNTMIRAQIESGRNLCTNVQAAICCMAR